MGIGSWAGLWFALGIPAIILMYLFKRKFIDTPVASHLLWRRVLENTEANRPWQKLRNRLVMWLQLLAAAVLAFALMRPFLWAEAGTGGHLVIVADVSASMSSISRTGDAAAGAGKADDAQTRLDQLKKEVLADTRQSTDGLTLIRMGSQPQVTASGSEDRESWKQAVQSLSPDYGRTAYREALSLASAVAEGQKDARIVVYTDGQWSERTDDLPLSVPIEIHRVTAANDQNASIEQFGVDGSGRAVGVIANTGGTSLEVTAELSGDGRSLNSQRVTLKPGERQTIRFDRAASADVYRLSLTGAADDYAADDDAFAFPEIGGTVKVLLLSDGNLFLEKALQLSGAEVTRLSLSGDDSAAKTDGKASSGGEQAKMPPLPEQQPDLVVVEGSIPEGMRSGEWGRLLSEAAIWTIGGTGTSGSQPADQRVEITAHPVTRYLSLTEPYFGTLTGEKPAGLTNLVTIGGRPAIAAGTEQGRRSLWFGFNLQSGDLPLNSEFPVLVNNAVSWLAGGRGGGLGRATAGAAVEVPIAAGAEQAVWKPLQGLAFETNRSDIPAEQASVSGKSAPSASQPAPNVPGLYAFEQIGAGLEDAPVYMLDVRPDASESASPSEADPTFAPTEGAAAAPDAAQAGESRGRLPLTIPLAALVAAIMLTEWGVYRRGRSI
ncbi:hypothetical protein B9G55_19390 [Saccharibacillus sp. O16]|nr:hypothetical protein B9G55_19390 [Saccharibacillus sp. O16]